MRAAQAGKTEALNVLIERHYPRVYSFVSYLSSGKGTAEDLTQEVFTRALSALPRFNGQYQFEPWLLRIARNLVIDEARRDIHRASPTDPNDLPGLETTNPAADHVWESMSQQLAASLVKQALQKLPMRQRTVLVLREIEGLAYADIAQVIGANVRGVEATLRRARARFRMEIANVESSESERATCHRTLRSISNGNTTMESRSHLASCKSCRSKSSSVRSADGLFALLPPVALPRQWRGEAWELASTSPASPGRSLLQVLRSPQFGMVGPIAQIAEMAAVFVVSGSMAISSAAGQFSRNANLVLAAPPAFEAPVMQPSFSGSNHIAPEFAVINPAPAGSQLDEAQRARSPQDQGLDLETLISYPLTDFEALNNLLGSTLTDDLALQQQVRSVLESAQLGELTELLPINSASAAASADASIETDILPLPGPASSDPVAASPVAVSLPRRRSFPSN